MHLFIITYTKWFSNCKGVVGIIILLFSPCFPHFFEVGFLKHFHDKFCCSKFFWALLKLCKSVTEAISCTILQMNHNNLSNWTKGPSVIFSEVEVYFLNFTWPFLNNAGWFLRFGTYHKNQVSNHDLTTPWFISMDFLRLVKLYYTTNPSSNVASYHQ